MKKLTGAALFVIIALFLFPIKAGATSSDDELWLAGIWDSIDSATAELMSGLGIDSSYESFLEITPAKTVRLIVSMIRGEATSPLKNAFLVAVIIITVSIVCTFLHKGTQLHELACAVGLMFIIFSLLTFTGEIITDCRSALKLTKDFMLSLIPALTGVVAMAGDPLVALSFNTVAFAFCESVSVFLINWMPSVACISSAIAAAGSLSPVMKLSGVVKIFNKAVVFIMGLVCSVFVAVLSIRGVIAGAADTATIKGMRFLIGNSVPIVGSAIGDALNSIIVGVGLLKHTMGILGITALIFMTLPSFIRMLIWKFALVFLGVVCEIVENDRIKGFIESLNTVLSVITAVMCFNVFVYIISVAIIVTVKGAT